MTLSFGEARAAVLRELGAAARNPAVETAAIGQCRDRVLAEDVRADRDYPPFNRAMRDGFALRASDMAGRLRVIGEVRAGSAFTGVVSEGEAVEIMTGAPVPEGADAVAMVEFCTRLGDGVIETTQRLEAGANISPRGCEAEAGSIALTRGLRIDHAVIGCLASLGHDSVRVLARPHVAILTTGDEIVSIADTPGPNQIRNSNAWQLSTQVRRAGGTPIIVPIARDSKAETRRQIEIGLDSDLLLITGGVSAGKYDVVEPVVKEMGAEIYFDRVTMQPGQPVVFGSVRGKFFFGLPGNPASAMVTFEVLARAAVELLAGMQAAELPLLLARVTVPMRYKPGLTRFLPAIVRGGEVTPVAWKGSGDLPSLARANAFLVTDAERADYAAGDLVGVILK